MKALKWIGIVVLVLAIALFALNKIGKSMTKKHSPEEIVQHSSGEVDLEVFYCRPYKKNRQIFDSLVPYGVTWRTGANEATTFSTSKEISIGGKKLAPGKYSLWTVPKAENWEVIWNKEIPDWGVSLKGVANHSPESDVLSTSVAAGATDQVIEQFTISFAESEELKMVLEWDRTRVEVPIKI